MKVTERGAFAALTLATVALLAAMTAYGLRSVAAGHYGDMTAALLVGASCSWCTPAFARAWARAEKGSHVQ